MNSQAFRQYYGSGETWYLAREVDTEIERLTQERDNAIKTSQEVREDYIALMREIQRYQPAGSPPPGDALIMARWIFNSLQHNRYQLASAVRHLLDIVPTGHRIVRCYACERATELANTATIETAAERAPAGLAELDALNHAAAESLPTLVNSPSQATGAFSQSITIIAEIMAERQRQIEVERWSPEHDDEHDTGQLARAAACYAYEAGRTDHQQRVDASDPPLMWPFENSWWKPRDHRRDLVRSAALIVAEIERLDRAALIEKGSK